MFDIDAIRKDFPTIHDESIYLDSAASSLTPYVVLDTMADYYLHHRTNLHRSMHKLAMETARKFDASMENIAQFIGANVEDITITSNATAAINLVALSLDFQPDDEIIISTLEHSSNVFPWMRLATKVGVKLRWWKAADDGTLDLAELESLITPKTRLVAVTHVSNVLGVIVPVAAIGAVCQEHNVLYLVDACQSVPHLPIDVKQIGCDFLAFSGHKMCGPTGIGVLYLKPPHARDLTPAFLGGGSINTYRSRYATLDDCTLASHNYSELPHKWMAGTPPIAETFGLSAAIDYLRGVGMDAIVAHDTQLIQQAINGLQDIPGVILFGPSDPAKRSGIISFNIQGIYPLKVGRLLTEDYNIGLRAGHNCALHYFHEVQQANIVEGNVRASFYLYTTPAEVDLLINAIREIAITHGKTALAVG
ncbi:aminotransferase class V-fold PLP-dependent enzyme [Herpetosiphon giganteus]|uniref:aminotransferase class V-fold PLP-dependent enzyme n=1 Tax=Herpetosiphon giganteus TaxID=2029754 RepID=UPI0019596AD5|nr:cysteine desulfurase [Herpetosiphon giganteus]MBM7845180.1 cysteine desulfurase/selenocysteine lyase [Herpetosiphon giganteus]